MEKKNDKKGESINQSSAVSPPVQSESALARTVEYEQPDDFPSEGGLYLIEEGEIELCLTALTPDGRSQPSFIQKLEKKDIFYCCATRSPDGRALLYQPVDKVKLRGLLRSELISRLRDRKKDNHRLTALLVESQRRLVGFLAEAAGQLPEKCSGPLPQLTTAVPSPATHLSPAAGVGELKLKPGEIWRDDQAIGAEIISGNMAVGPMEGERWFCIRGPGLQATLGVLALKAETEVRLRPEKGAAPIQGGDEDLPAVIASGDSICALIHSISTLLDREDRARFQQSLELSAKSDLETKAGIAAQLISLRHRHRTMPLVPAVDPQTSWLAAVKMLASYEGKVQLVDSVHQDYSDSSDQAIDKLAESYGLLVRRLIIGPGDLSRLSSPIIARQADGNPLVLDPVGNKLWAHDPLRGSGRVSPRAMERELPGEAYELTPVLDEEVLTLRGLLRLSFAHRSGTLLAIGLVSLVITIFSLLIPVATKLVFGVAVPADEMNLLNTLGVALLASAVAVGIFTLFRTILLINLEALTGARLESNLMSHILRFPLKFFRGYRIGDLEMRIEASDQIRSIISGNLLSSFLNGIFSFCYLLLMFYYGGTLAFYGMGLIFLAMIIMLIFQGVLVKLNRIMLARSADQKSILFELIRGILTLRATGAAHRFYNRWLKIFAAQIAIFYRVNLLNCWMSILYGIFPIIGTLMIYYLAVSRIFSGEITLGDFIAFTTAFSVFLGSMLGLFDQILKLRVAIKPLWERVRPLFASQEDHPVGRLDPGKLQGKIELRGISFRYGPGQPEVTRDVSLIIHPGEYVALTGPSGAGKTTLIRLMLGLEELTSGAIYYDRYNLQDLSPRCLKQQIGVVLQQSTLFSGSIKDNIRLNAPTATMDEIISAAQAADIHDDIMELPMRYETIVSEGGATFSGGQVQRIAIARALLAAPRILYFDEATSSLDNISQAKVEKALDNIKATRFVVAHRLSTIKNADRIIVLDQGSIIQTGNYQELMKQGGLFKEMVGRQLL